MPRYLFMHVPKTAGTSLWTAFVRAFGRDNVSNPLGAEFMTAEEAVSLQTLRVVAGHISHTDAVRFFPDTPVLTVLRDPVDRCVSSYYFFRHDQPDIEGGPRLAKRLSIEEFFNLPVELLSRDVSNRMTRQLGGHARDPHTDLETAFERAKELLSRCAWVGFQHTLDRDYVRLADAVPELSTQPLLPWERVTSARPKAGEIPAQVRERIIGINRYDTALYAWALDRFGTIRK